MTPGATTRPSGAGRRWLPSLPVLEWGRRYDRETLTRDAVAALIVTIMLIPQSLAYAREALDQFPEFGDAREVLARYLPEHFG